MVLEIEPNLLKTFYYSLIEKQGSKSDNTEEIVSLVTEDIGDEADCEACKL